MDVAFVIDVVGPDDVRVVELGDRAGFEPEPLQIGRIVDAILRQHLDRHAALHELVLGQVDAAHAALADLAEQLVLAQAEALVLAGQQLVGLPARDQAGLDQQLGQLRLVLERRLAVLARRPSRETPSAWPRRRGCCAVTGRPTCWWSPWSLRLKSCTGASVTPTASAPPHSGHAPNHACSAEVRQEEWSPTYACSAWILPDHLTHERGPTNESYNSVKMPRWRHEVALDACTLHDTTAELHSTSSFSSKVSDLRRREPATWGSLRVEPRHAGYGSRRVAYLPPHGRRESGRRRSNSCSFRRRPRSAGR